MRLYLSSFHLGRRPDLFADMIGEHDKVALILDAGDAWGEEAHRQRVKEHQQELATIGVQAEDLDLRAYFGRADELREDLNKYGGVWVPGGNTFVLRRAMYDSGFDVAITDMLRGDDIAYGGYSAGICVLAPGLRGIDLADHPAEVATVFARDIVWDGLSVLSFLPVPHYQSDHPESTMMNDVVAYMEREGLPYKTLRDGEAFCVNGESEELVGVVTDA